MPEKFRFRYHLSITTIVFVFAVILFFVNFNFGGSNRRYETIIDTSTYKHFEINDTLRYYEVKRIQDSLDREALHQRQKTETAGSGLNLFSIGVMYTDHCDTCTWASSRNTSSENGDKYFFALRRYEMYDDSKFSVENGNYYLTYPEPDRPNPDNDHGHLSTSAHLTKKKIQIRYSYVEDVNGYPEKGSGVVLVPVSSGTYNLLNIIFIVMAIIVILTGSFIIFSAGLGTLYLIAAGKVFTLQNTRNLSIVGWSLIGFAIIPPLLAVLFWFMFRHLIPSSFYYPFWESIFNNKPFIAAGIIVLLLAKAFRRGYRLQQEQDLTI